MLESDIALRHLRALVAIVEHGSYRQAGEALGYSQATITQQIRALERAVGVPVFQRHGGPRVVTLTEAGRHTYSAAQDILGRARMLGVEIDGILDGSTGRLAIGTFQSVSARLLPGLLAGLMEDEPGITIDVFESDDNSELISRLLDGRLDVTFLIGPIADSRLVTHLAHEDPFIAMASTKRSLPERLTLTELARIPLIGHDGCLCHDIVDRGFRQSGLQPEFVFRSNDNGAIQAMTRVNLGVAVMPAMAIDASDPAIAVVPIESELPARQILVALPRQHQAPVAQSFVERVIANLS